jgi:hypothetical protein
MLFVWDNSDITVAALIKVIYDLTTYRVRYDKAWRVKEHALTLCGEIGENCIQKYRDC